jgi:hypothetical protein
VGQYCIFGVNQLCYPDKSQYHGTSGEEHEEGDGFPCGFEPGPFDLERLCV